MPAINDPVGRTCPHCKATITSEDFFCRACHRRFELRGAETDTTRLAVLPESSVLNLRSPVHATIFSFVGAGLGQLYNGDLAKGFMLGGAYALAACLPLLDSDFASPYWYWVMVGAWCISLVEAPVSSWRINRLAKEFSGPSLLFWVEALLLMGLLGWFIVTGTEKFWVDAISPAAGFFL